jgi:hypothetical protein
VLGTLCTQQLGPSGALVWVSVAASELVSFKLARCNVDVLSQHNGLVWLQLFDCLIPSLHVLTFECSFNARFQTLYHC